MPTVIFCTPATTRGTSWSATDSSTSTTFTAAGEKGVGAAGSGFGGGARQRIGQEVGRAGGRPRRSWRLPPQHAGCGKVGGAARNARTRAALPAVGEGSLDNVLGSQLNVGVGTHDCSILAAQLHLQGSTGRSGPTKRVSFEG